jgi:hypothetical protein
MDADTVDSRDWPRLRGTGSVSIQLAVSGFVGAAVAAIVLVIGATMDSLRIPIAWMLVGIVAVVYLGVLAVRSLSMGIFLGPRHIEIRNWYRNRRIGISDIEQCGRVSWTSWILWFSSPPSVLSSAGSSSGVQTLRFELGRPAVGRDKFVEATASSLPAARRHVAVINGYLAVDPSTTDPAVAVSFARGADHAAILAAVATEIRRRKKAGGRHRPTTTA